MDRIHETSLHDAKQKAHHARGQEQNAARRDFHQGQRPERLLDTAESHEERRSSSCERSNRSAADPGAETDEAELPGAGRLVCGGEEM